MGVYYSIVNKTKRQYVRGITIDRGIKYGEVLGNSYGLAAALFYLLTEHPYSGERYRRLSRLSGTWDGDQVETCGDWHPPYAEENRPIFGGDFDYEEEKWEDIGERVAADLEYLRDPQGTIDYTKLVRRLLA